MEDVGYTELFLYETELFLVFCRCLKLHLYRDQSFNIVVFMQIKLNELNTNIFKLYLCLYILK